MVAGVAVKGFLSTGIAARLEKPVSGVLVASVVVVVLVARVLLLGVRRDMGSGGTTTDASVSSTARFLLLGG